jgi:hypothetical protein
MACQRHYYYIMKNTYRNRYDFGSRFIDNNGICVYCGSRATTLDHFVPLSVLYMLGDIGGAPRVTLECCSECNTIAGSHVFRTIGAKREYIHRNLEEKYHVLLDTPEWDDDEMSQMGYNMQVYIKSHLQFRDWIKERVQWQNKGNPAAAEIARIRSKLGASGRSTVRRAARMRKMLRDSKESA